MISGSIFKEMMILIYISSKFEDRSTYLVKYLRNGQNKIMGFHQPPLPCSLIPPPHHGCRNDYLESFGAVYWTKKLLKNLRGLQKPPFGGLGLILPKKVFFSLSFPLDTESICTSAFIFIIEDQKQITKIIFNHTKNAAS